MQFSFNCTACGRCCNSSPEMTFEELQQHEQLFIGCLAVARQANGGLLLSTQGFDYSSIARCPALQSDGLCSLHAPGKPGACQVVPLNPHFSDEQQVIVLQRRHAEATFLGAQCITTDTRDGYAPLADDQQVLDVGYRKALHRQRSQMQQENLRWADRVRHWLTAEASLAALRPGGYLALPLVPILAVLAETEPTQRPRGERYAQHQLQLIERSIDAALQRRNAADRASTAELRRFAQHYRAYLSS